MPPIPSQRSQCSTERQGGVIVVMFHSTSPPIGLLIDNRDVNNTAAGFRTVHTGVESELREGWLVNVYGVSV